MRKLLLFVLLFLLCVPHVVAGESLVFQNEMFGLSFTLPDGWQDVSDESQAAFIDPENSDMLLLVRPTGHRADEHLSASFDAAVAEAWMRDDTLFKDMDIVFTTLASIMFASTMDENGRIYALHTCFFAGEGFPEDYLLLYLQCFLTGDNGELCSVSLIAPNNDVSNPILEWFDDMVMENIPQEVMEELYMQIDA